jgi:hypothetical protein
MNIEFLVEEPSMEEALNNIVPMILGPEHTHAVHNYGSKDNLLKELPNRLLGYKHWIPDDWRIVVLIDEDRADCNDLKARLETIARDAGMATKTNPNGRGNFSVLNRIVIEELEAWFFGDVEAMVQAYPKVSPSLGQKAKYRDPDAIGGGTWEALERVLQKKGYHSGGLAKIATARDVAPHMDPDRNRSKSFQVFRDGLREMISVETV